MCHPHTQESPTGGPKKDILADANTVVAFWTGNKKAASTGAYILVRCLHAMPVAVIASIIVYCSMLLVLRSNHDMLEDARLVVY